jgi:hypothetical protein
MTRAGFAGRRGHPVRTSQYHLVLACHAAGRYLEALDASIPIVEHLEQLRRAGNLADREWPDECRLVMARCYHRIGEPWAALSEYGKLIHHLDRRGATGGDRYTTAVAAAEGLRRELGLDAG